MERLQKAAGACGIILALGLCLAASVAHAQGGKVFACTSEPVEREHIVGANMQNGALAARVFLVRFSPTHSVLQFDPAMVEIWDDLRLWERPLEEALADPTVPAETRSRAGSDETTMNWMAYLTRYHRAIAAFEAVDTTQRATIDAAIEHYAADLPDWRRVVVTPEAYRGMLVDTQRNYETERRLPAWQAFLQAAHAVENYVDKQAGQIVTEKNVADMYTQGRRDWQLRLALSRDAVAEAGGADFDQRLLSHYITYREVSLNCAGYLYREGITVGAHESMRRLLGWLPVVELNGVGWHRMAFDTRDWGIALYAAPDFSVCFVSIGSKREPDRSMTLRDPGCAGRPEAADGEDLSPLQARQAALFENYRVIDVARWSRDWAGVSELTAGPTMVRYLQAQGDFFETQSTGTYDFDITTVSTSTTVETRGGVRTVTDGVTTETQQNYEANTIGITLGPDEMQLLYYGTTGAWRCFHGLVGVGRTQLLDSTFLGFRENVDRVIFNTPACPGILSSMFVNEREVDGLFGTILAGQYMKEVNGLINLLARTVIETVKALETVDG